jgi:molecular chaperone GrpE
MATEKRHIPINSPFGFSPRPSGPAGGGSGSGASGARPGASAPAGHGAGAGGPGSGGQGAGGASAAALAAQLQALVAERDALVAENDALIAERDGVAAERDAVAKERDTANDGLLRLRAEFDNYRRRTSREVIDAGTRAQCDLLGDMLPVLDNLDRALDAAEHHEEGKVLDGVRLTRKLFVDLLSCTGVQEIEGLGEAFDPNQHEAVMVTASDQPEGTVAVVLQKGYRQGDRVLRPARVAVSAGNTEPAIAG